MLLNYKKQHNNENVSLDFGILCTLCDNCFTILDRYIHAYLCFSKFKFCFTFAKMYCCFTNAVHFTFSYESSEEFH